MKIKIFTILLIVLTISKVYAGYSLPDKVLKEKALFYVLNNKTNQNISPLEVDDILEELDDESKKIFESKFEEIKNLNNQSKFLSIEDLDYYLLDNNFKNNISNRLKINEKVNEKEETNIWLTLFVSLFLINIAGLIFFFKDKNGKNFKKETNQEIDSKLTTSHPELKNNKIDDPILQNWNKKCQILENELKDKEESLKAEKIKIEKLTQELNTYIKGELNKESDQNQIVVKETCNNSQKEIIPLKSNQKFYVSKFNINGYFENNNLNPYGSDDSYYMIEIENNIGKLFFNSNDSTLKRALYNPDNYIKPFCDNQNVFNPTASKIITVEHGVVIREGDLWKVQTKAQIKYE